MSKIPVKNPKTTNIANFAWVVETARVTAFPIANKIAKFKPYKAILRKEPEQIVRQAQGTSFEAGPYGNGRLFVGVQPGRADLILNPNVSDTLPPSGIHSLGTLDEVAKVFTPLVTKVWDSGVPMRRCAVGLICLTRMQTPQEACRLLAAKLPYFNNIANDVEGLGFEISRPVISRKVPGLQINRLFKWHVIWTQQLTLMADGTGFSSSTGSKVPAIRMEVDIHTDENRTSAIPAAKIKALASELYQIGFEMAVKGDFQ